MQSIDLLDLPVKGAVDREVTPTGVVFRRLPEWTRPQLLDPGLALVVAMPAGVRLEFTTDSPEIELDLMLTVLDVEPVGARLGVIDLVVGDEVVASRQIHAGTRIVYRDGAVAAMLPGEPATVRFDELPGDGRTPVEVWLPHIAVTEIRGMRLADGATMRPVDRQRPRWVHVGSSISHCASVDMPTATWPAIVAMRGGLDLTNLGFAGNCMLDPFTARTVRDLAADLISVKAGINIVNGDSMRERTFTAALHGFLDTIRDGHPATPLLVVTPIVCPVAEDHPGPTVMTADNQCGVVPRSPDLAVGALTLRRIRALMTEIVQVRRATDPHLHLLDGLSLFGIDDVAMLPDGLHPDADGYRVMADRFCDLVFTAEGPFAAAVSA